MVWSSRSAPNVHSNGTPSGPSAAPSRHGHGHTATYQRKSHTYRETAAAMESRVAHRLNSNVVCVVDPYSRKLEVPRNFLHETHAHHRVWSFRIILPPTFTRFPLWSGGALISLSIIYIVCKEQQ